MRAESPVLAFRVVSFLLCLDAGAALAESSTARAASTSGPDVETAPTPSPESAPEAASPAAAPAPPSSFAYPQAPASPPLPAYYPPAHYYQPPPRYAYDPPRNTGVPYVPPVQSAKHFGIVGLQVGLFTVGRAPHSTSSESPETVGVLDNPEVAVDGGVVIWRHLQIIGGLGLSIIGTNETEPSNCTGMCEAPDSYKYLIWFLDLGAGPVLPLLDNVIRVRGQLGYRLVLGASYPHVANVTAETGAWAMGGLEYYWKLFGAFVGFDYRRSLQPSYVANAFYFSLTWGGAPQPTGTQGWARADR